MIRQQTATAGFTLIEIIVAIALLAITLALSGPALTDLFSNLGRGAAATTSDTASSTAIRLAESDIEQALADRPTGDFNIGATPINTVVDALKSTALVNHDIVLANRTQLAFYADVLDSSIVPAATGPEFVIWQLLTDDASCGAIQPNWCIQRTVSNTANTTQFSNEAVTSGTGLAPTDTFCAPGFTDLPTVKEETRIFCFRRSVDQDAIYAPVAPSLSDLKPTHYIWNNPERKSTCTQQWWDPAPPPGPVPKPIILKPLDFVAAQHNSLDTAVQFHAYLDTITSIGIVMPSTSKRGGANERAISYSEVPIRSRQSPIYLAAIMCGAR